jgi:hypothetical protein
LFTANNKSTVLADKYNDSRRKLDKEINLTSGMAHLRGGASACGINKKKIKIF